MRPRAEGRPAELCVDVHAWAQVWLFLPFLVPLALVAWALAAIGAAWAGIYFGSQYAMQRLRATPAVTLSQLTELAVRIPSADSRRRVLRPPPRIGVAG